MWPEPVITMRILTYPRAGNMIQLSCMLVLRPGDAA